MGEKERKRVKENGCTKGTKNIKGAKCTKTWKRMLSQFLAFLLAFLTCVPAGRITAKAETYGKNGVVREMSSQDLVYDMGLGYNIGNTFDSIGSWINETTAWDHQRGWGNEPVNQTYIRKIRESGFKTVRLPVSWANWLDGDKINPEYMTAVQTVVDWILEEDMYVILNIHHDSGAADISWVRNITKDHDGTLNRYKSVWNQIAENFKDYGDHLIFESMNEVEFPGVTMSKQYELLNEVNQTFVDTVRATGGNNAGRHLLIAGYNTDIRNTSDSRFHMPEDPVGRCILSIHYYSPSPFCVAEHNVDWCTPATTWGSEEEIAQVYSDLDILAQNFLSKGVPVIIGEYGVLTEDNKEKDSIHKYLRQVPEIILQYGMCPVLWDTSEAGDMRTIARVSGEFFDPVVKAGYRELADKIAGGQIQRKIFERKNYKEVQVPISSDGWVSLESFQPSKIVGIKFTLESNDDWDSYGGGGILLDSWDNTIEYQFNSPGAEVVHMFTAEERARIKDQIGVLIWWTDESKGGNHVSALTFKNHSVTLLYDEQTSVGVVGTGVSTASTGKGGSGGSGGGGGSASRPNNSTTPGGTSTNNGTKHYEYSLRVARSSLSEEQVKNDFKSGIYYLDLETLCPGYEEGDEVTIQVSPYSDGGYSYALVDTSSGYGEASDSFGTEGSWTVTPGALSDARRAEGYGQVGLYLWYMGGSYFLFNLDVKVTKKAPKFETLTVKQGETTNLSLKEVLKQAEVDLEKPVKLTIAVKGESGFAGNAVLKLADGTTVRGIYETNAENQDTDASVVLIGNMAEDAKLSFEVAENSSTDSYQVVRATAEQADFGDENSEKATALALFPSGQQMRVLMPKRVIQAQFKKDGGSILGAETGLKVYYSGNPDNTWTDGMFSINGDSSWTKEEDEKGTYLWLTGLAENPEDLESLEFYSNHWDGEMIGVTGLVAVKRDPSLPDQPENPDIPDVPGEDGNAFPVTMPKYAETTVELTEDELQAEFERDGGVEYGEKAGLKLYYTGNPDNTWSTGFFSINDQSDWEKKEDGKGTYLWYTKEGIDDYTTLESLKLYCNHWDDEDLVITGLVAVTSAENSSEILSTELEEEEIGDAKEAADGIYALAHPEEYQELEAEQIAKDLFLLPANNTPVGMRYLLESAETETDEDESEGETKSTGAKSGRGRATLRVASASNWDESSLASPSNASGWKTVTSKIPTKVPDDANKEVTYLFDKREMQALADALKRAREASEPQLPAVFMDLKNRKLTVKRLTFLYQPDEILEEEIDSESEDILN